MVVFEVMDERKDVISISYYILVRSVGCNSERLLMEDGGDESEYYLTSM